MATGIFGAGSFAAGEYYLAQSFDAAPRENEAAIAFTGPATLDLMGRKISGSGSGNTWDKGIVANHTSTIFDSKGDGGVQGFRVGVHLLASTSLIRGVDLSNNRYIGAWLQAQGCKVHGGRINNIGGVNDEAYAIGIQVNGLGCEIAGVEFRELYRQASAAANLAGEGLPVNFAAPDAVACVMSRCIAINTRAERNTYGVFAGSGGGGHHVTENMFWNFWRAVAVAQVGTPTVRKNFCFLSSPLLGSQGISSPTVGVVEENTVIGYENPMDGRLDDGKNVVLNFPTAGAIAPPPTVPGVRIRATKQQKIRKYQEKIR